MSEPADPPDHEGPEALHHARLSELVLAALELPEAERSAFLSDACGEDRHLREEVEALLGWDVPAARQVSARLAWRDPASDDTEGLRERRHADALLGGVPGYRIVSVLGQGGMGIVYEAEQEMPRRRVALKVIRGLGIGGEALRRFTREAHVLGRLHHPGICQVHEVSRTAAGDPFIAMELIEGTTLLEHVKRAGLGHAERLALFCRICDAMAHAHERGIVHRDLKPDNILVTKAGDPKVLDFGIARSTEMTVASTLLTTAGAVMGTIAYMSPEQAAGNADIDARSDVFTLGVILFELLSGQRPSQIDGLPLAQALHVIQQADHSMVGRGHPSLKGDLETIVGKALERDPARRYETAEALARDVRRHLTHEPIVARPPGFGYRAAKFTRRHRRLVAAAALVLAALSTGTTLALWQRGIAIERAEEAGRQAYRAILTSTIASLDSGDYRRAAADLARAPVAARGWEASHLQAVVDQAFGRMLWEGPAEDLRVAADGRSVFTTRFVDGGGEVLQVAVPGGELLGRFPLEARPLVLPREALALGIAGVSRLQHEGASLDIVDAASGALLRHVELCAHRPTRDDIAPCIAEPGDRGVMRDGILWVACDLATQQVMAARLDTGVVQSFSLDGAQHLSMNNRQATVRDARTWAVTWQSPLGTDGASSGMFSGDGRFVYTGGIVTDPMLRKWSLATGGVVAERRADGNADSAPWTSSADGSKVALVTGRATAQVFDADLREELARRAVPSNGGCALGLTPDASRLVIALGEGGLRDYDLTEPPMRAVLRGHGTYVYSVAFSPDGSRLASSSFDGTLRTWDVRAQQELASFEAPGVSSVLAWSRDGRTVHAVFGDEVVAFDAAGGETVVREGPRMDMVSLEVDASGTRLLLGTHQEVRLLDSASLELVDVLPGAGGAAWSPDGLGLATGAADALVVVRDADTLRERWRWTDGIAGAVALVAWSPDGRRIVASRFPGDVKVARRALAVFDARDGRILAQMESTGEVLCLAWTPDGRRIVTGTMEGDLTFWDAGSGEDVATFTGHRGYVKDLAFSPDGRTLASASGDGDVRLWRAPARD